MRRGNPVIRKIDKTGSADQASDSGRRRSARMCENIQVVEEFAAMKANRFLHS